VSGAPVVCAQEVQVAAWCERHNCIMSGWDGTECWSHIYVKRSRVEKPEYCYDADELNQQPWYMILNCIRSIQRKETLILRF